MKQEEQTNTLQIGSMLREYEILSVLGQGGFGITYKARDTHLDKIMVIKEYMPNAFASRSNNTTVTCIPKHKETFEWGLKSFLNEAKTLSKFDHISIVKALNFFEANGTAYFVMDFYEGETLEDYLIRHPNKKFSQDEILSVMMPIIEGLKAVHTEGFLHRDIAPDNIFLRQTKPPILIDFGASRNALGVQSQSIEAIVKHGYSPPEQYISRTSKQNETTDLYAISAVIYQMITGTKPPESTERQSEVFEGNQDLLVDIVNEYKDRFEASFLKTITKGLSIKQNDRVQSIREFQEGLVGESGTVPSPPPPPNPKNNTTIILSLIIVVMMMVIVGGYFMMQKPNPTPAPIIDSNQSIVMKEQIIKPTLVAKKETPRISLTKEQKLQTDCNSGNIKACGNLGMMYYEGNKIPRDKKKAMKYSQQACDNGDAKGCSTLIELSRNNIRKQFELIPKAVEYYKEACKNNNAKECKDLAYAYDYGYGVTANQNKAIELYEKACTGGDAIGCSFLGGKYQGGYVVTQNYSKAVELYNKSCSGGSSAGCNNLALMYEKGKGVSGDKNKSIEFYKRACALGDFNACGYETNRTKVMEVYTKACDDDNINGCSNLGWMYYKGDGVVEDKIKALELHIKSCELGSLGDCANVGTRYLGGHGVESDYNNAVKFLKKACDGGVVRSCTTLGEIYNAKFFVVDKNTTKALALLTKACDGNDSNGCVSLGELYEKGDGVDKNISKALAIYQKSCALKNVQGCANYNKYEKEQKLKKECDGGNDSACLNLGDMYRNGDNVPQSYQKAFELYQKACNVGENMGCAAIGILYRDGLGVQKDTSKAIKIFTDVCHEEKLYGCSELENLQKALKKDDKWITPTDTLCKSNGGEIKNGVCEAPWQKAKNICSASGGRLPTIKELEKVVSDCGGTNVKDSDTNSSDILEKNQKNSSYKSYYQLRGFISEGYWSSSRSDHIWYLHFKSGYANNKKWYDDYSFYVRCVREENKYY